MVRLLGSADQRYVNIFIYLVTLKHTDAKIIHKNLHDLMALICIFVLIKIHEKYSVKLQGILHILHNYKLCDYICVVCI